MDAVTVETDYATMERDELFKQLKIANMNVFLCTAESNVQFYLNKEYEINLEDIIPIPPSRNSHRI